MFNKFYFVILSFNFNDYNFLLIILYTEQKYKRNTFVFAPIFHELNSKI